MGSLTITRATLAALAVTFLASCQSTTGSFCQIAKPIRPSQQTINNLSDAEVSQLLAHNRKGARLCGWRA